MTSISFVAKILQRSIIERNRERHRQMIRRLNCRMKRKDKCMKTIVIYFSAETGRTAGLAADFAKSIGADLYEILPENPYTKKDLNYMNPLARCNKEFAGRKDVPVKGQVENWEEYDRVFIGFPIWYGHAPNVVSTFCKGYDWSGKQVYAFATSGGSKIGKTAEKLAPYVQGAAVLDARLTQDADALKKWGQELR